MLEGLATRQRGIPFYMGWFARVYHPSDSGWVVHATPDGKPIFQQDAFFWFSLETIARELNAMRALEIAKMSKT